MKEDGLQIMKLPYKLTELFRASPPFHPMFATLPGRWAMSLGVRFQLLLLLITDDNSLKDVSFTCQDTSSHAQGLLLLKFDSLWC